jgi:hypothetical protein
VSLDAASASAATGPPSGGMGHGAAPSPVLMLVVPD